MCRVFTLLAHASVFCSPCIWPEASPLVHLLCTPLGKCCTSLSGRLRANEGPYGQARHVMPQHTRRKGSAACLDSPWCAAALLPPSVLHRGRKEKNTLWQCLLVHRQPASFATFCSLMWLSAAFLMSTGPEGASCVFQWRCWLLSAAPSSAVLQR